jgi:hypothetical protein
MGANPKLTLVKRFARENSNDRGEKMSPYTAKLVSQEFLLFMWGIQKDILKE